MTLTFSSKWDFRFLEMARLVASWSKDPSTKAGAVIVRPDFTVVSVGFNGFPSKMPDFDSYYADREQKYSRIVHAEVNAQIFAKESLKNCTLYTYPFIPCDRCAVQMIQAGITRIVAPIAPPETLERWVEPFARTRKYCQEAGVDLWEISF
jgi:dCMP deaminase